MAQFIKLCINLLELFAEVASYMCFEAIPVCPNSFNTMIELLVKPAQSSFSNKMVRHLHDTLHSAKSGMCPILSKMSCKCPTSNCIVFAYCNVIVDNHCIETVGTNRICCSFLFALGNENEHTSIIQVCTFLFFLNHNFLIIIN